MINLAQLFKDTSITVSDSGGTVAPTIHLGGVEGCIHVLVQDWEELHSAVMALIDGVPAQLAAANDQAPAPSTDDAPTAEPAPAADAANSK